MADFVDGIYPLLVILVLAASLAMAQADSVPEISYTTPPNRVVWIEGESCTDHNWTLGPAYNCWAFEYGNIHGGVLDLASWRLPAEGCYYARYEFELSETNTYIAYYMGRDPAYQGCPITWQIDDGPENTFGSRLASTLNMKYALTTLGRFEADAGRHTITIRVSEGIDDGYTYYSQQIDAILISMAEMPFYGAPRPEIVQASNEPMAQLGGWANPVESSAFSVSHENVQGLCIDEGDEVQVIQAGDLKLTLSGRNGGVRGLEYGEQNLLTDSAQAEPLLMVSFLSGIAATNSQMPVWRVDNSDVICSLQSELFTAEVVFSPDAENDEVRINARITNTSDEPICQTVLAPLVNIALNDQANNDVYRLGHDVFDSGFHRRISPQFSFDWICVTDDQATLYARYEDIGLLDTEALAGFPSDGVPGCLVMRKSPRILPGATWQCPTLVLGGYGNGDWHLAADRFSQWWHSWALRPHIPQWVRAVGGITLAYSIKPENALVDDPASVINNVSTSGIYWGHCAAWLPFNTEAWYPLNYKLNPTQLAHMADVVRAIHDVGGRVSVYTNGLMFSRVTPEWELYGEDLCAVAQDGGVWLSEHTYRHHPMGLPYPNARWAQEYVRAVEGPVILGGVDTLYMDQLGAVPAHLDYAPERHGHEHYGEWIAGTVEFVRTVHERLMPQNPDLTTMIERPCPAAQQYVTFGLLHGNEILRYTFPYYYNISGCYDSASAEAAIEYTKQAFMLGQPVLLIGLAEEAQDVCRSIIQLKQCVDPLLYEAVFRDTVGVELLSADTMATVFDRGEDGVYVTMVNNSDVALDAQVAISMADYAIDGQTEFEFMTAENVGQWHSLDNVFMDNGNVVLNLPVTTAAIVRSID
ncbi:MAG: hypothetical protein JW936_01840 [Sedimentisphaerales bacterium]|nr:hypothetical protein [Sedimentisphaerales bacterium]